MKSIWKIILSFLGSWIFWVLTGDFGSAILGLVLINYLEFRHTTQSL